MSKVSVIIPVYNIKTVIYQSVYTLVNQTLEDIEFIFVNDGLDSSELQIIPNYAKNDKRIKILSNETNMGPGYSRNRGIKFATGEYIAFFDPDDYVDLDFYEKLYIKAKECDYDVVVAERIRVMNDKKEHSNLKNIIKNTLKIGKNIVLSFNCEHQSAIYKNELVKKYNICNGLTMRAEDTMFLLQFFSRTNDIAFVDGVYYYYVCHDSSLTTKRDLSFYLDNIKAFEEKIEFINAHDEIKNQDWSSEYILSMLYHVFSLYKEMFNICELVKYRKDLFEKMSDVVQRISNKSILLEHTELSFFVKKKYYKYLFFEKTRNLFSVVNDFKHRVVTILGIKISIRLKKGEIL